MLDALKVQSLSFDTWELVVVDNGRSLSKAHKKELSELEKNAGLLLRIVEEERLGLSQARVTGIQASSGEILVFVDDDNVLAGNYLEESLNALKDDKEIIIAGGKIIPDYQRKPPSFVFNFESLLALCDHGEEILKYKTDRSSKPQTKQAVLRYPVFAPVGAGMVIRAEAAKEYAKEYNQNKAHAIQDRKGKSLSSGGDNDLVLSVLAKGGKLAYLPTLSLTHIIPKTRLTVRYLARANYGIAASWVLVLEKYHINPWNPISPWTVIPRAIKALFRYKPWRGATAFINWAGACGNFKGRSALKSVGGKGKYSLKRLARSLYLGRLLYLCYYLPKHYLKYFYKRNPLKRWGDFIARKEMERAAFSLSAQASHKQEESSEQVKIHLLTGKRFWYQSLFCAYSFAKHSNLNIEPHFYDDGSLLGWQKDRLRNSFKKATIYSEAELNARLDKYLPHYSFPTIRARREFYPHLKKLTDIHAGGCGFKVVLDSDMLFFKPAIELINWIKNPVMPCCMQDIETAYGYSIDLLESLAGAKIPQKVNVGVCGLNSSDIDWEKLEYWLRALIKKEGSHYTQEQALVAMLLADQDFITLSASDYIVSPSKADVAEARGVLQHYVADSKIWYFRKGWQRAIK